MKFTYLHLFLTLIIFALSITACVMVSIETYKRKSNCENYELEDSVLSDQDELYPYDVSLKYNPNKYRYNRFRIRREKIYNE